jgi:hypothetical protein
MPLFLFLFWFHTVHWWMYEYIIHQLIFSWALHGATSYDRAKSLALYKSFNTLWFQAWAPDSYLIGEVHV